ncbi:uncharacterized protein LOC130628517 isoform X2 [Hydractinia symbiolongicarpus]|uniref:uncharacterized protein LOC130628517 isoform X2 n=1 Tax=Hydractinia symbiolongicarpus TaxID=13093 RepID=UPI00254FFA09|nr:uncharacterized protein LOC130628517 isoform X2 [Hydractinia symbiolongicarpus]
MIAQSLSVVVLLFFVHNTNTLPCSDKFNATGESSSSYLQPLSSHDTAILNQSGDFYPDRWFKRYQTLLWKKLFQNITKEAVVIHIFGLRHNSNVNSRARIHDVKIQNVTFNETCDPSVLSSMNKDIQDNFFDKHFTADSVKKVKYKMKDDIFTLNEFDITFAINDQISYIVTSPCNFVTGSGGSLQLSVVGYVNYCPFELVCGKVKKYVRLEHTKCQQRPVLYPTEGEEDRLKQKKHTLSLPFLMFSKPSDHIFVNRNGVISVSSISVGKPSINGKDTVMAVYNMETPFKDGIINSYHMNQSHLLKAANKDISRYSLKSFFANQIIVVNYIGVKYQSKAHTFQAVFATDGNQTYVILNYYRLESNGATVGFSERACGHRLYYNSTKSKSLAHTSNVGMPGRHVLLLTTRCAKAELYPYGNSSGDVMLEKCESCIRTVPFRQPSLFNNMLVFTQTSGFAVQLLHRDGSNIFIFPFYNFDSISVSIADSIYYRETNETTLISEINSDIKLVYAHAPNMSRAIIITFKDVHVNTFPTHNSTYQIVIAHDGLKQSYLFLTYDYLNTFGEISEAAILLQCSVINVKLLYNYGNAVYLMSNTNMNKLGRYIFHSSGRDECKAGCSPVHGAANLFMLKDVDLQRFARLKNFEEDIKMQILGKVYGNITEKLYITIFGNLPNRHQGFKRFYNLTVTKMAYTESCNLNQLYVIKDAINTIQNNADFQPTKFVLVSYNIQKIWSPLDVIFALHGHFTIVLIHQCPKTNVTINTVGYFKSCSFLLACFNESSHPFAILDHSTCARKDLILYPYDTRTYQDDKNQAEVKFAWHKPFLLFSTPAKSMIIGDGYLEIRSKSKSRPTSEKRILDVYRLRDLQMNNLSDDFIEKKKIIYEYSIKPNLLSAASKDISSYSSESFSAKHLLIVTFAVLKKVDGSQFTFQAVIASDERETYAILNYKELGGRAISVGYEEPLCGKGRFSKAEFSQALVNTSNIGIPGRHVFPLTSFNCTRAAFYPYGIAEGDRALERGDNVAESILLNTPLPLKTKQVEKIYVTSNGLISMEHAIQSSVQYTHYVQYPYSIIASYYMDFDTSFSGVIYYRQTKDKVITGQAKQDIKNVYHLNVDIGNVVIVTYVDVPRRQSPLHKHTFQTVIAYNNNNQTFLILNYKKLDTPSTLVMFSEYPCCKINITSKFDYDVTTYLTDHTNADGLGKYVIQITNSTQEKWANNKRKKISELIIGYDFVRIRWKIEGNSTAIITMNIIGQWQVTWVRFQCKEVTSYEFEDLYQTNVYRIELMDTSGSLPALIEVSPAKFEPVNNVYITQDGDQMVLHWTTPTRLFGNDTASKTIITHWSKDRHHVYNQTFIKSIYEKQYLFNASTGSNHKLTIVLSTANGQLSPARIIFYTFSEPPKSSQDYTIIISATVSSLVFITFVLAACYYRRKNQNKNKYLQPQIKQPVDFGRSIREQSSNLSYDSKYEFPRTHISLIKVIGEGEFAQVWIASAKGIEKFHPRKDRTEKLVSRKVTGIHQNNIVVAKTLKENATEKDHKDLANELKLLIHIGEHRNIVNLVGACTKADNILLLTEYCEMGSLAKYLRLNRDYFEPTWHRNGKEEFNCYQVTWIAVQVADGMSFLKERKYVHRDLAARTVFLTKDMHAKVADLGLMKNAPDNDYYKREYVDKLPIKWMAPESILEKKFTTKSDVWSFGVLLWEIYSLGALPYPDIQESKDLLAYLKQGSRMSQPVECAKEFYDIMLECWSFSVDSRPSFNEIRNDLDRLMVKKKRVLDNQRSVKATPTLKNDLNESDYSSVGKSLYDEVFHADRKSAHLSLNSGEFTTDRKAATSEIESAKNQPEYDYEGNDNAYLMLTPDDCGDEQMGEAMKEFNNTILDFVGDEVMEKKSKEKTPKVNSNEKHHEYVNIVQHHSAENSNDSKYKNPDEENFDEHDDE